MNSFKNLVLKAFLLKSSQCAHDHPRVEAWHYGIRMEVRGDHDYYGHVFAGSEFIETRVKFDTMSEWTVLT